MSDPGKIGECNACHRAVRYVVTILGSIIPLDIHPHAEGMVAMVPTAGGERAKIFGGSKGLPPDDAARYIDHRSVCARRQQAHAEAVAQRKPSLSSKRCPACMLPLDAVLADLGEIYHPCCSGHPHHMAPTYIEEEQHPSAAMLQRLPAVLSNPGSNTPGRLPRQAQPTSEAAAVALQPVSGAQRLAVLNAYRKAGADGHTDQEIERLLYLRPSSASTRRKELVEGGWLVDSGRRRLTDRGNESVVWVLSAAGRFTS